MRTLHVAPRRPTLTICGGGNAGHALAVVASQHFDGDIDWLVGSEARADLLQRGMSAGGLRSTGVIEAQAHRLRTISADPAEVVPDADILMIVVPAFVHALVLDRIRPHVSDSTIIGCLPTRGGFEFEAARLVPRGSGRRKLFGLQTLPWSTRVVVPGATVNIGAAKAEVVLAALPAAAGEEMAARVAEILGTAIVPTEGFLNLTLGNPGQFIHPGLMYGHLRSWNGEEYDEDSIPLLYAHATDEMGEWVARLSDEAVAVARAIEEQGADAVDLGEVVPVHEWLISSYAHVTEDLSSVATCLRTGPIKARLAPMIEVRPGAFVPNFAYRYLTEDVPYGLVITHALAELVDVATPTIDSTIRWAQRVLGKEYLVSSRLVGADASELPTPQNHGITSLYELLDWYADDMPVPTRRAAHPRYA